MVYVISAFSDFLFLMFLRVFLAYFALFSGRTGSRELKRKGGSKTQTNGANGEKAGRGREWGPTAGEQVSAATQRTCTSDSGTDVCTTLSPRHDSAMTNASGKGGCERDDSTVTMKLEVYGLRCKAEVRHLSFWWLG